MFVSPLLLATVGLAAGEPATVDLLAPGPATPELWSFYNGAEFPGAKGELNVEPGGEVTLSFDFTGGGAYVAATRRLEPQLTLRSLSAEVLAPVGSTLTVRVADSQGQSFQKSCFLPHEVWQPVEVDLTRWGFHFGGANDGVVRWPLQSIGFLFENKGLGEPTGRFRLRHAIATLGEATETAPVQGSYRVTDFGDQAGFGGGSGTLRGRVWKVDLSARDSVWMGNSLSLLGTPSELSVKVKRATKGCRIRVQLGSHFQTFTRVVGTCDGGEQSLTVPAPPDGWEHYGGEDDGVVRHPLRVTAIIIERGDAPAGPAEVEFEELRCRTTVDRAHTVTLLGSTSDLGVEGGNRRLRVTARAWNLLDRPLAGDLSVVVRDWDGHEVFRDEHPWTLPPDGVPEDGSGEVAVPADLAFAEASLAWRGKDGDAASTLATYTRPLADAGDATVQPESPWGMGLYLYRYPGDEAGLARMDQAAAMGQAAGVKWSREEFQWHRLEPERGKFDFSYYDKLVDTAARHGISVYGLLAYWSEWTKPYTEEGVDDYVRWARQVVRHYRDRIKHWEIYNEPNIFFWSGPKELYPVLLTKAYQAIKEEDPEAEVLGCSTAGIDNGFIQRCLDAKAPFDVLTIHPYRGRLSEDAFVAELQHTAEQVGGRPVWITEMGWSTQVGASDEREQAELLSRAYLSAIASGACQNISWYDFRCDGIDPFYNEANFGVVRYDLSPKPAYRALATICRGLANGPWQPVDLPAPLLGLASADSMAVWSPTRPVQLRYRAANGEPLPVNLMGEPLPGGDLRLEAGRPVVFRGGRIEVSEVVGARPDQVEEIRF